MVQRGAMRYLSDELLLETYYKARELKLSDDFINLVQDELNRRSILDKYTKSS